MEHTTTAFHSLMLERCDRCGAQAKLEIILLSQRRLRFCSHHYRAHYRQLENVMLNWEKVS
jgi:hypothetical protein